MNRMFPWLFLFVAVGNVVSLRITRFACCSGQTNFYPKRSARFTWPSRARGRLPTNLFGIEDFDGAKDEHRGKYQPNYMPQSIYEVNRKFRLSSRDVQRIKEKHDKGSAGVIISLDTALLDLTQLFGYSYAMLSEDLDVGAPDPATIGDLVGSTFRDYVIALGWSIPTDDLPLQEEKLFACVDYMLDKLPIEAQPGCVELVNSVLEQGNDIIVVTSLPRPLALKVLGKSQLSRLFEGRVNSDRLFTYNPPPPPDDPKEVRLDNYGDRYMNKRFLQMFGILRKPPVLCVLIDGNRRHILSAKRNGVSCIALGGFAEYFQDLRFADSIAKNLPSIKLSDINKLIERAVVNAEGPPPQLAAVPEIKKRKLKLPVLTMERPDPDKPLPDTDRPHKPSSKAKKATKTTQITPQSTDPEFKAINTDDDYQYDVFDDEDAHDRARYTLYEQAEESDDGLHDNLFS